MSDSHSVSEYESSSSSNLEDEINDEVLMESIVSNSVGTSVCEPLSQFVSSACVEAGEIEDYCLDCEFQAFFLFYYLQIYLPNGGSQKLNVKRRWWSASFLAQVVSKTNPNTKNITRRRARVFYYGGWVSRMVIFGIRLNASALIEQLTNEKVSKTEALERVVTFLNGSYRREGTIIPRFIFRYTKAKNEIFHQILTHAEETKNMLTQEYGPWPQFPPSFTYDTDDLECLSDSDCESARKGTTEETCSKDQQPISQSRKVRRKSNHFPTSGLQIDEDGFVVPGNITKKKENHEVNLIGVRKNGFAAHDGHTKHLLRWTKELLHGEDQTGGIADPEVDPQLFDSWIENYENRLHALNAYERDWAGFLNKLKEPVSMKSEVPTTARLKRKGRSKKAKEDVQSKKGKKHNHQHARKKKNQTKSASKRKVSQDEHSVAKIIEFPVWCFLPHPLTHSQLHLDEMISICSMFHFSDYRAVQYRHAVQRASNMFLKISLQGSKQPKSGESEESRIVQRKFQSSLQKKLETSHLVQTKENYTSAVVEYIATDVLSFILQLLKSGFILRHARQLKPSTGRQTVKMLVIPGDTSVVSEGNSAPLKPMSESDTIEDWLALLRAVGFLFGVENDLPKRVLARLSQHIDQSRNVTRDLEHIWTLYC